MKTAVRRLKNLKIRFGVTAEAMRKAAVPSADRAVVAMLAAGEWQSALQLAERRDLDPRQERQLIEHWGADPNATIDQGAMGLTRMRKTLDASLSNLPPELRSEIARRLLEADKEWEQPR